MMNSAFAPASTSGVRQSLGDHGLAQGLGGDQHEVLGAFQEPYLSRPPPARRWRCIQFPALLWEQPHGISDILRRAPPVKYTATGIVSCWGTHATSFLRSME